MNGGTFFLGGLVALLVMGFVSHLGRRTCSPEQTLAAVQRHILHTLDVLHCPGHVLAAIEPVYGYDPVLLCGQSLSALPDAPLTGWSIQVDHPALGLHQLYANLSGQWVLCTAEGIGEVQQTPLPCDPLALPAGSEGRMPEPEPVPLPPEWIVRLDNPWQQEVVCLPVGGTTEVSVPTDGGGGGEPLPTGGPQMIEVTRDAQGRIASYSNSTRWTIIRDATGKIIRVEPRART